MLQIIAWIIIIIAIFVIFAIVAGKFPALALLDIDNIPGEKEARFKEQIMRQKVERDLMVVTGVIGRIYLFISRHVSGLLKSAQTNLKKVKLNYKKVARIYGPEKDKLLERLFVDYQELFDKELWNQAEDKLLEIINFDQKNLLAFFKLAELYDEQKKWPEAKQTYGHALKLARQSARYNDDTTIPIQEIYFSLAESVRRSGDNKGALDNVREALEYEPNSPRYLDLILDLSIIEKDKELAQASLSKLAVVNPENQKLNDLQDRINELQ